MRCTKVFRPGVELNISVKDGLLDLICWMKAMDVNTPRNDNVTLTGHVRLTIKDVKEHKSL